MHICDMLNLNVNFIIIKKRENNHNSNRTIIKINKLLKKLKSENDINNLKFKHKKLYLLLLNSLRKCYSKNFSLCI